MPFGVFGSRGSIKFSKKRTYSVQHNLENGGRSSDSLGRRRSSAPAGILKKSGRSSRPTSYPALAEGMVPSEMAAAVPMPSEVELNMMFAQMVDELGLNRELMFKLPLEKRWELYLSKQKEQQSTKGVDPQPEYYIDQITQMSVTLSSATAEKADSENNLRVLSELKTALRTQPISFVLRFIEQNGLEHVLGFLQNMNVNVRQSQLHYTIVGCIKALMNNPDGRAHVLAHPAGIIVIAQSLRTLNLKTKILALEILGALCLVPGGHRKVLFSMDQFRVFAMERARFQTLMIDLTRSLEERQDSANLQIAVLSFINVLINYKAGEESLEFRLHLRHEFLMQGILPIINQLRALNIAQLNKHLEIFELVRLEDERELASRLESVPVDCSSLKSMLDLLQKKTAHTMAYSNLLSIIYHCLLLPIDDPLYAKYWSLIDRLVQQVVLQQRQGVDPDVSPVPINVDNIVQQLAKEDELRLLRAEAEEMRKARDEFRLKLRKKEWECESRMMERDQQRATVEKLRLKINRKASELNESWNREQELQERLGGAEQQVEAYQQHIVQLETMLRDNNIKTDQLPTIDLSTTHIPLTKTTPPAPPPPVPPPPPILPSSSLPPPPPAPPAAPIPPAPGHQHRGNTWKKQAPQPSQALKSLNWAILPPDRISKKSIWTSIDESKVHAVMDLKDFEHTFSAYQPRESSSPTSTLRRRSKILSEKTKELSIIDGRRAQNCTILLSKLKMTEEMIKQVIFSMDKDDQLNKDMVEQMLKYVPTSAERELLESHTSEKETFARADRFMLEMSRIPRYSQRLKFMYFMKTRDERLNDLTPHIEDIMFACKELINSEKLHTVLEVVLAFGNFMNRGARRNAFGFRLASLNRIIDTKSSANRDITLLHYLIKTLETKFPDTLTLETELPHVRNASKVDLKDMEKEFTDLKMELRELEHEIEHHQQHRSSDPNDLFLPTMEGFARSSAGAFERLEKLLKEMRVSFEETMAYFGEDVSDKGAMSSTDEFFGIFGTFLQSFSDSHVEIIAIRKKKEEEKKRKEELERQRERTLQRRRSRLQLEANTPSASRTSGDYSDAAEFDELIAVLKTGEYFSRRRSRMNSTSTGSVRRLEYSRDRPAAGEDTDN